MLSNKFVLITNDGNQIENPTIQGLKVEFFGSDNIVEIEDGATFHNCHFKMRERCKIIIRKTHPRGLRNTIIDMAGTYDGYIEIDSNTSIESARFAAVNDRGVHVYIGKNCMLSSNITFRATDGHVIFDNITKQVLNKTQPIRIGNHVWLGANVTILKGTRILDDSIVATNATVSKKFPISNIIIGGNPANILKYNINWDRQYIRDSGDYYE